MLLNLDNTADGSCYALHEAGHARFLYHKTTGHKGPRRNNVTHHNPAQERCAMSYRIGPDVFSTYQYPFCGKCILRLRGFEDHLALHVGHQS